VFAVMSDVNSARRLLLLGAVEIVGQERRHGHPPGSPTLADLKRVWEWWRP